MLTNDFCALNLHSSIGFLFLLIFSSIDAKSNGSYLLLFHFIPPLILQSPCPSVRLSVRSHFRNRYLSFYWKKWFDIWYMAFAWWLVPCLPFPGIPHIYFLCTVRLRIFHVCRNENFRNSYLSFYWKKWFYIWYYGFGMVTCTMSPLSRFTAHLLSVYRATYKWTSGGILSTT